jgi:glycosyltransferase involved in cell wall biosynthesis
MPGILVFIPAWNEEASLPAVIADCHAELPDADVLVIDDGSTDATRQVARDHGADVVSFPFNRGLRAGIAEGYRQALNRGYDYCGRLDADGQHLASELKRMLELVTSDECDVAVGSRFLPESGTDGQRYKPTPERLVGTSLLRLLMRLRLGQPISDGGAGAHARTRARRVLLPRQASGRAGGHDRPDVVRGQAAAPTPRPTTTARHQAPTARRPAAAEPMVSATVPTSCVRRPS